jgi:hypothetical protein
MKSTKKDTQKALLELIKSTIANAKNNNLNSKTDTLVGIQKYHKNYLIIVIENKNKHKRILSSYALSGKNVNMLPTNIQDLDIFYTEDEIRHGKNIQNGKILTQFNTTFKPNPNWIKKQLNKLRSKLTKFS